MATRTKSRSSSTRRTSENRATAVDRSAFSWGDNAGPIIGAAIAGAAIGFAANYGRKFLMQGMEAAAGDWDAILAAEHDMALQAVDIVGQMLGHIANVVRAEDPRQAIDRIGMCELRAKLSAA